MESPEAIRVKYFNQVFAQLGSNAADLGKAESKEKHGLWDGGPYAEVDYNRREIITVIQ